MQKLRILSRFRSDPLQRLGESIKRLFALRFRWLDHQRLVHDEREVDRGRMETVVD